MTHLNDLQNTLQALENNLEKLQIRRDEIKSDIDNFEFSMSESEFDDYLDERGEEHTSVGTFYPSDILKSCDPVAYRCAKSDYEANFDLEYCEEYQDLLNDLDNLDNEIADIEQEIENVESEIDNLESE